MISDEKQYEHTSKPIAATGDISRAAFRLFLQMFSAIIAGSVWLSLQPMKDANRVLYARLSDLLVGLLTFVVTVIIYDNARSWFKYRILLSEKLGGWDQHGKPNIPPPSTIQSLSAEAAILLGIWAASGIFFYCNPFSLISN